MARRKRAEPLLLYGPKQQLVTLLKGLREASEMTRAAVAESAGLTAPFVGEVLHGFKDPSPDAARRLATAMGATPAVANRARDLAEKIRKHKLDDRGDRFLDAPLPQMVTALLRAWRAAEPDAAERGLTPDSPVQQALETAIAGAITQYTTGDGRLDIAGPLLTKPSLLTNQDVAAEFAKVLAGQGTPDLDLIGQRWRGALTDPTHTRDFAREAQALLESFTALVTGAELGGWLRGNTAASPATLAASGAKARKDLADAVGLMGKVTVGALAPGLRMRLCDQTGLIAEHVSGFVGRDALLARINEVIKTGDSGYCHVLAHPGVGKTALMARLIRDGNYIHHFNSRAEGVVSAETFLGNVCARLIARYELPVTPGAEKFSTGSYLSELLTEIARRRRAEHRAEKIIIVVDALDERDVGAQLPGTNPLFLPGSLPDGVFFVVSSRPEDETRPIAEWQPVTVRAGGAQVVIPVDHLGDDNMTDIRTYLEPWPAKKGVAAYMERFGYTAATFVEELAQRSEGNFMYLHHMLPAIDDGLFRDRELAGLPLGLLQYYSDQFERMRDEDAELWYKYRRPVITAFVVMRGQPLTLAEIAALSDIGDEAIVKDTLRKWSAFVVARPMPGEDGRPRLTYRIYHESFADFLRAST